MKTNEKGRARNNVRASTEARILPWLQRSIATLPIPYEQRGKLWSKCDLGRI